MQLGVFSLTDMTGDVTPGQRVRDIVDFGVHADELGLDVFGVGEHHTPRFAVSSPAIVLAAIAARTSTVTLTSAVSVLSVLDPVRLYQDFAQLDLVAGGRAEVTVGRSAYREPFEIFGIPLDNYDDVFQEKLGLLLRLRAAQEGVTWTGRYRSPLDDALIIPRLERPLPIRVGVGGTPESAVRAGALGLPMTLALLGGDPARMRPIVDRYRAAAASNDIDSAQLGVAGVSHFFVGSTSQEARETFYPAYRTYFRHGRGVHLDRATFNEMAAPHGPLVVGSPQEVTDKILRQHELLTLDRFIGQVDLGGLPREHALASLDRFASDVAPAFRQASQR
ncbi:LLM class flavin-dependent oxidoreductase [Frondihabitans sp. VKM Ac-2883]|uniref:LLM class flavin-dependent oxidoreductase n=1 Tax=Frondihabitans sp. VKM Ac-2883 TaxID=2783823 RepID=UPI00188D7367|nr:LLM class flavin-dependent oxidoreductase [Frondihabitans sp. VKM Ac-2883]MBF4577544.1 LLM class flavin-dependent oxidoreductase [Frondihabitans sp. VKM Ac-2883]